MSLRSMLGRIISPVCTRWLSDTSSTPIPREVLESMLKERQTFKKGQICDQITVYARAGAGGHGFPRRNGMGGDGGDVWMEALPVFQNLNHLHHHHSRRFLAERGDNSSINLIRGRKGEDCIIEVPIGTIATDIQTNQVICDVDEYNTKYLIQRGTPGGSLTNNYVGRRAPDLWVRLVLKTIADVGLVGYPNAGKSSLLSLISRASPTVGSYPFTTLKPTVGYLETTDRTKSVGVADIPGLIEGASENRGLGHVFLRHIERTSVLLFVIDVGGFQLNMKSAHRTAFETFGYLCRELELYMGGMTKRPVVVAINKMDTDHADEHFKKFVEQYQTLMARLVKVHSIVPVSCYTGQGILDLQNILYELKYGEIPKAYTETIV